MNGSYKHYNANNSRNPTNHAITLKVLITMLNCILNNRYTRNNFNNLNNPKSSNNLIFIKNNNTKNQKQPNYT